MPAAFRPGCSRPGACGLSPIEAFARIICVKSLHVDVRGDARGQWRSAMRGSDLRDVRVARAMAAGAVTDAGRLSPEPRF